MAQKDVRRILRKSDIEKEPYQIWNAYINLICMTDYHDLNDKQRIAHLAFWYDTEVQNGGHMQYFANSLIVGRIAHLDETLKSLVYIGALTQRDILLRAIERYKQLGTDWHRIESIEKYCDKALNDDYDEFDSAYYRCEPETITLLETYLQNNMDEFVIIKGASGNTV